MTEHKFTDDEVIRALECCVSSTTGEACDGCPLNTEEGCETHSYLLESLALDLINRQKAENERLSTYIITPEKMKELRMAHTLEGQHGDPVGAQGECGLRSECQKKTKIEAFKEFAERLKYTLCVNNEENTEIFDYAYTLETIDNLVKEMTEGEN